MMSTIYLFLKRHASVIFLGVALLCSLIAYIGALHFDTSRIQLFGPTATLYIVGIQQGLFRATALLAIAFILVAFFSHHIGALVQRLETWFDKLSSLRQCLAILFLCIGFVTTTHFDNIRYGYFFLDDFEVADVHALHPLPESLLVSHGDHPIPLYRIENAIIYQFFHYHPLPYNIFVLIIFSLIPFFTYLIFKERGYSLHTFLLFLVLYSGTTNWSEFLTGYYVLSIYLHVVLFFAIALWALVQWNHKKKKWCMAIFASALVLACASDISSLWIFPVLAVAILLLCERTQRDSLRSFIASSIVRNAIPLTILAAVFSLYAIFLWVSFTWFHLTPFIYSVRSSSTIRLSETILTMYKMLASGLTLPLVAPHIPKLLNHPALLKYFAPWWPMVELIFVSGNILLFGYIFSHARKQERTVMLFLATSLIATMTLVAIGRPNSISIPDFYFQHVGNPFYFFCFLLAIYGTVALYTEKISKKTLAIFAIVFIALTFAFSFHSQRLIAEAKNRNIALTHLHTTLLPELEALNATSTMSIPNLDGMRIHEPLGGISLADYFLFFDTPHPPHLIQTSSMFPDIKTGTAETVPHLHARTSKEFIATLHASTSIRAYYFAPAQLAWSIATSSRESILSFTRRNTAFIASASIDPEQYHTLELRFSTADISGNSKLSISYDNDFDATTTAGYVKIDDFLPFTTSRGRRYYALRVDLLQLYSYALSTTVKNITVTPASEKDVIVDSVSFTK